MGFRINKAIGWAMPCAEDPIDREGEAAKYLLVDHAAWLLAKAKTTEDEDLSTELEFCGSTLNGRDDATLGDCVIWTESLNGGTLIVLPAESADSWYRQDDDMDFSFAKDETSSIEYTGWGFHPYGGLWMDALGGQRLNQHATTIMRVHQRGNPTDDDTHQLDRLAQIVSPEGTPALRPYLTFAEAVDHIVPLVPDDVRWVAEHLGLFETPSDILKLRPARATWWE
ncbi:hypothetical protein IV500_06205 [Paeniglutamicibacter antarcticus]|uniref:Uncharacterized protein n=1 Tax=Arthrobacter terrae TaxID=2935737 RepID=A0A931CQ92_9MICC|nr:hypothetical protein [Arthrobacter terrae]MBG0739014.1 hypothetical protein [Arthrobacter terrae]